uniref:Uncharacterized protein n=1 Tax=Solanum tuberosum TaxID=4113 RepID=M1DTR5_SOLTU
MHAHNAAEEEKKRKGEKKRKKRRKLGFSFQSTKGRGRVGQGDGQGRVMREKYGIAQTLTEMIKTKEFILQATLERSLQETSVVGTNGVTLDSPIPPTVETCIDASLTLPFFLR